MKKSNFEPLVSIIMNCHNGGEFLNRSLSSVLSQNYKNWELIFFDNMSIDNSLSIAKSFKDPRIKIFSSNIFLNLYQARNNALKKILGKYVCFLDTDDYWVKNKIKKQINYLKNNLNYSMVYSNYNILEGKKNYIKFNSLLPYGSITNQLLKVYTIGILTTCIRADVFKKNKFNGLYNIIGDFDFFLKVSLKHKIGSMQESLATYRVHKKNYSFINLKQYIIEFNTWIKDNEKNYKERGFSLFFLKFYLLKLKIKYCLTHFFKFNIKIFRDR